MACAPSHSTFGLTVSTKLCFIKLGGRTHEAATTPSGDHHPTRVKRDDHSLIDILNVCRERIWLIVGMALTCALLAPVWSYLKHPIYEAKATVVIEQEGAMR